jgi:23S rRNA (pseudouridine1915-N3)-methyltransferase
VRLKVVAVGARMPAWVDSGFQTYATRLPRECALSLVDVPLERRSKTTRRVGAIAREGRRILDRIGPDDEVIALDVTGRALSTEALAGWFEGWFADGRDRVFLIGGPDGLAPACLDRADWRWSLSPLTLPHGLARVVTAEALYRAFTVLKGHPYHRA